MTNEQIAVPTSADLVATATVLDAAQAVVDAGVGLAGPLRGGAVEPVVEAVARGDDPELVLLRRKLRAVHAPSRSPQPDDPDADRPFRLLRHSACLHSLRFSRRNHTR